MLLASYRPLLDACRPYVLATSQIAGGLDLAPFGVRVPEEMQFDPQRRANATFLRMTARLDEMTFGPMGMPMPNWVFYDCAVMPGAVFGLARSASELEPWVRLALDVPKDYNGPVPMSMFIAIPLLDEGAWLLYTLCDVNDIAPGAAPGGIAELTMVLGIKAFQMRQLYGTTQWRGRKLRAASRLGPLEVVTAWTPAHSLVKTLTFRTLVTDDNLRALLVGGSQHPASPLATHILDVDNVEMLRHIQGEVEDDVRWLIVGSPTRTGAYWQVPMRREDATGGARWS